MEISKGSRRTKSGHRLNVVFAGLLTFALTGIVGPPAHAISPCIYKGTFDIQAVSEFDASLKLTVTNTPCTRVLPFPSLQTETLYGFDLSLSGNASTSFGRCQRLTGGDGQTVSGIYLTGTEQYWTVRRPRPDQIHSLTIRASQFEPVPFPGPTPIVFLDIDNSPNPRLGPLAFSITTRVYGMCPPSGTDTATADAPDGF